MGRYLKAKGGQRKGTPVPAIDELASDVQKKRFLAAIGLDPTWNVAAACKKAGLKVKDIPRLLSEDPKFRDDYEEAEASRMASLQAIAFDRAGRPGGDSLLKFLLAGGHKGGQAQVSLNITPEELKTMTTEELRELKCRLNKS